MPDEKSGSYATGAGACVKGAAASVKGVADETMNDVQKGLAWFITMALVALIFVWVFRPPQMAPESMAQLNSLVSTLQTLVVMAFGFFLGSSKATQNKDEAQAKSMEIKDATLKEIALGPATGGSAAEADKAAAIAAPPAAAVVARPAAEVAAPPAAERAVSAELARRAKDELDAKLTPTVTPTTEPGEPKP